MRKPFTLPTIEALRAAGFDPDRSILRAMAAAERLLFASLTP